jgi:L-serine deaminase
LPPQHRISAIISFVSGIIGVVTALVVAPYLLGNVVSDVAGVVKRMDVHRAAIDSLDKRVSTLEIAVSATTEGIGWLKETLREMKSTQERHYKVSSENRRILEKEIKGGTR